MSSLARQALISRPLDFWLLGGLSLLVLAALIVGRSLRPEWLQNPEFWFAIGAYLRVGLEYPHLLATYKLAYSRGWGFLRAHIWSTIVIPIAILGFGIFALAVLEFERYSFLHTHAHVLVTTGIQLLFFGFGWHRLRQVWGCTTLYARYDGLRLNFRQRISIHAFLISMWIFGYFQFIASSRKLEFFGFNVSSFHVPSEALLISALVFAITGIFFVYENVFAVAKREGRFPSVNFFVPLVALLFWWAAIGLEPAFFFFLAPSFHSLQYLAVVWAFERGPLKDKFDWKLQILPIAGMITVFIALGFVWENSTGGAPTRGSAAIAIAYIVVSLHHYLLDGVIWRTRDSRLKNLLE